MAIVNEIPDAVFASKDEGEPPPPGIVNEIPDAVFAQFDHTMSQHRGGPPLRSH
jgi:hypothetical protein